MNNSIRLLAVMVGPFAVAAVMGMIASLFPRSALFLFPVGLLLCIFWALYIVGRAAAVEWGRSKIFTLLMLPSLLIGLGGAGLGSVMGDYLHLVVAYPEYVLGLQQDVQTPERFYWGDYALFVTDGFWAKTLIYDPAHQTIVGDRPFDVGMRISTYRLMTDFYIETVYLAP